MEKSTPSFYFYTNTLAPYMFHRWELMLKEFPNTHVFVTRKPDKGRPWNFKTNEMPFPCFYFPAVFRGVPVVIATREC